ncbi:MAG: arginase family protein [Rickettsiales bacterium]|jgi:arginase|nr:arginase family protein [Rickettsiales bacterium]
MVKFIGVSYGRGGCKYPIDDGCEKGPVAIAEMFPEIAFENIVPNWDFVPENLTTCEERLTENLPMQKIIYDACSQIPTGEKYILLGGDHSVNFAHFKSVFDKYSQDEIALVYIDAHLDIHSPVSSSREASGSPHGMNVRHLLAIDDECDERYLNIGKKKSALKPENLFYLGTRSYEPSEKNFIDNAGIFSASPDELNSDEKVDNLIANIREKIGNKKMFISFDFDCIDTEFMLAVQVPEPNGINLETALRIIDKLVHNNHNLIACEFVEFAPRFDKNNIGAKNAKLLIEKVINNWI